MLRRRPALAGLSTVRKLLKEWSPVRALLFHQGGVIGQAAQRLAPAGYSPPEPTLSAFGTGEGGSMKFVIYTDSSGKYRWRLVAGNGQTVASSGESFDSRANARRAAENVQSRAASATVADE